MDKLLIKLALAVIFLIPVFAQTDTYNLPVVYKIPDMENSPVIADLIYNDDGNSPLAMDIYYPRWYTTTELIPVVIFINGTGDNPDGPSAKSFKSYKSRAQLAAASGLTAVVYEARPGYALEDTRSLIDFLRMNGHKYNIDKNRIALWACSDNVQTAADLLMEGSSDYLRCGVVYYGSAELEFIRKDVPVLLVSAGKDDPQLNNSIDSFKEVLTSGRASLTHIDYKDGGSCFDLLNDSEDSREVIKQTLQFLCDNLYSQTVSAAGSE